MLLTERDRLSNSRSSFQSVLALHGRESSPISLKFYVISDVHLAEVHLHYRRAQGTKWLSE